MHSLFCDLHKYTLRHKTASGSIRGILLLVCFLILACSSSVPTGKEIPVAHLNINDFHLLPYDAQKLKSLMEEDVESFYDIQSKYYTEIELKFFRNSNEPKKLRQEMRKELASILKKTYVMEIGNLSLDRYDLKKQAFEIYIGNLRIGGWMGSPKTESRMLDGFWFDDLPFMYEAYYDSVLASSHYRHLYLRVNEEIAMKLGQLNNAVYLVFNIINSLKNGFVQTTNVGMVVVDKSSGATLYAVKFSNFDEKKDWIKK